MDLDLYSATLVELAKDSEFCEPLEAWTHRAEVSSTLCGDELELSLFVEDGKCSKVSFAADACVVCKASAVVMSRALVGQSEAGLQAVRQSLEEALSRGDSQGAYGAFGALARFPSRHSCALLPWKALERAQWNEEKCRHASQEASSSADARTGIPGPSATGDEDKARLPQSAFEAIEVWREQGQRVALATLVSVDGSSPSPLGSQMAIAEDGSFWGSVSGGCVETAVVAAGMSLLQSGDASAHECLQYTIANNSQAGEVGLPCGGQIEVYLCHAPSSEHMQACKQAQRGERIHYRVFRLDGSAPVFGQWDALPESLPSGLRDALGEQSDQPLLWSDAQGHRYFAEPIRRRPPLLIVGGTHVAQKLSQLAQSLGFSPVIIEPRAQLAQAGRFPGAQVLQAQPAKALQGRLAADTAVVMLTHNPRLDDPALKLALPSDVYYVGALGSRKTQRARLERLAAEGVSPELLEKIHGPVGLAIGAKGAAEIAISILSQVVQVRRNATAQRRPIGAVVLAAGASKRFGKNNKLLAPRGESVVVAQVVQRVLAAGIEPCVVVLGHQAAQLRQALEGYPVLFVENPDYESGMGSSVACGVAAMAQEPVDATFVVLGDMPEVRSEDYEALAAAHRASTQHLIVAPEAGHAQERRLGNPILWPRRYFDELRQLKGDRGAKALLLDAPGAVLRLFVNHFGVLNDVDTPEDLKPGHLRGSPRD